MDNTNIILSKTVLGSGAEVRCMCCHTNLSQIKCTGKQCCNCNYIVIIQHRPIFTQKKRQITAYLLLFSR